MKMIFNHASLFSGIGATEIAAEWMGWNNIMHCEINPFCQTILKYYWPEADSYEDIKKTDFSIYRGRIDILTGGFPCQPYSLAGLSKGTEDSRHLWPEMLRAIHEIKPRWILAENVLGIVNWNDGLVFEQVQTDMEAEGYEVQTFVLPASGVDAPHRRDRVWFVGYAKHNGSHGPQVRGNDNQPPISARQNEVGQSEGADSVQPGIAPDTISNAGGRHRHGEAGRSQGKGEGEQKERERFWTDFERTVREGHAADPSSQGLQSSTWREQSTLHSSPKSGQGGKSAGESTKASAWDAFPTQSPFYSGDDGISGRLDFATVFKGFKTTSRSNVGEKWRTESIKAAGNAMVPAVVLQIFKAIEAYEKSLL